MSIKSVESARDHIGRELLENEKILWNGAPDRTTLYRRLKFFCYRNLAFYLVIAGAIAATVWFKPDYAKSIIILLSGVALLRAIGAMAVWPKMTRRWHMAYALTDRRLIMANGRTQELSSWFSPCIDRLRIKTCGPTATLRLGDSELGFTAELYAVAGHDRLSELLAPYKMSAVCGPDEALSTAPQAPAQAEDSGKQDAPLAA